MLAAFILSCGSAAGAATPPGGCTEDLAASAALIERLYPGYRGKLARHAGEISIAYRMALAAAAKVKSLHDCDPVLFAYLQSFHEGHIFFLPADHGGRAGGLNLVSGDAPWARSLSKHTFYIRVPSFFPEHRVPLETLLKQQATAIDDHPFLIIDARGNHGGSDDTYASLLALVATGPIHRAGIEATALPELVAAWSRALAELPATDPDAIAQVREGRDMLAGARPGQVVVLRPDVTIRTKRHPSIRRVAILIDQGVASSAEQFLLDARQSSKVILIGTHSSGTLDYGDVRPFPLPSGERDLWLPTTRSHRLPDAAIDEVGIGPDVRSKLAGDDLVHLARSLLERGR